MKTGWFKKLASLLLALVMICGIMPMTALANESEEATENPWSGRSAVFVGDSITAGNSTAKYYQFLNESFGFGSVTVMGVGGSCISAASDYGQSNQPLINRYQNIPSADLIVVFMGTNDYGHETPLGAESDTGDGTFYGALNTIIPALVAKHSSSKIVFVTPLHRYGLGTSKILGTQFTYDSIPNGVGAALGDYVKALKTVCANNSVSVIDLHTECTLDPADSAVRAAYMPDGLHPNAAGHELIAGIMASHIRGYEPAEKEPVNMTEMIYGNKFSASNNQTCRASSRVNYYLKAGTVITLKNPTSMQWACAKTSNEYSNSNLGYFPDTQWTDKETAVVAEDGWVGFTFKYRDETQSFDLTIPLSDYISIEEPHTHTYENGTCTGCGDHIGPVITQQPTDAEATLGEMATVTVAAQGEGLKYQWYYKDAKDTQFKKSSVRKNTYSWEMTTGRAGREVYCVITDCFGNSVTSETATLIRVAAVELAITQQPTDAEATLGEMATVTVTAQGEGLKYQWYYKDVKDTQFKKSSVRKDTYSWEMTAGRAGREVYCVITDCFGNFVTSETATLIRVTPPATVFATRPTDTQTAPEATTSEPVLEPTPEASPNPAPTPESTTNSESVTTIESTFENPSPDSTEEKEIVDITDKLNALMEKNAKELKKIKAKRGYIYAALYYYVKVTDGGDWDIKRTDEWKFDPDKTYVYQGVEMRMDDPGNIHFGYLGAILFPEEFVCFGAGMNNFLKFGFSSGDIYSYFDDPQDQSMMRWGYSMYKAQN